MRIAIVENFGADFFRVRVRLAKYLVDQGHEVVAIVPNDGYVELIASTGIKVLPMGKNVRQRSLLATAKFTLSMAKIFLRERFDVIHFFRLQPNLIGTPLAGLFQKAQIFNHITGLGYAFSDQSIRNKILQQLIKIFYRVNSWLFGVVYIFQNEEDRQELKLRRKELVKGSATNEDIFVPDSSNDRSLVLKKQMDLDGHIVVLFISRLLRQKGIFQLVNGVKQLNAKAKEPVKLVVVGWIDGDNPNSLTEEEVSVISQDKHIVFLGKLDKVQELIAMSDICALPSNYREGTPRFLLEAMASSKAILTTDMPGCRHLVRNSENGVIVKPYSDAEVTKGLGHLIHSDLKAMGEKSYELYQEEFSERVVYPSILSIYHKYV